MYGYLYQVAIFILPPHLQISNIKLISQQTSTLVSLSSHRDFQKYEVTLHAAAPPPGPWPATDPHCSGPGRLEGKMTPFAAAPPMIRISFLSSSAKLHSGHEFQPINPQPRGSNVSPLSFLPIALDSPFIFFLAPLTTTQLPILRTARNGQSFCLLSRFATNYLICAHPSASAQGFLPVISITVTIRRPKYLTPSFVGGWTTVLAVAGVAGYRYYKKNYATAKPKPKSPAPNVAPRKQQRAKKQRQETFTSTAQKAQAEAPNSKPSASTVTQSNNEPDDSIDNKDFAKMMASVQEGKKFAAKAGNDKKRQKSVKQSRAAEAANLDAVKVEQPSAPSSTGGVDADDDASPVASSVASPEVAPADPAGISDMLEPAPSGPSVLRLTDTDKEKQARKATKSSEATKPESKKQRQNRKKAEERKAIREAEEKERKVLMEKQRRAAREAAGIPAKDGSQFMAAANGGKSAWTSGAPNGTTVAVQPLDTFEPSSGDAAPKEPATNGPGSTEKSSAPAKLDESWITAIPSEEEQMEMLKSEEEEWNTVPTKSSKKSKKTSAPKEAASAPAAESKPAAQASVKPSVPVNGNRAKSAQSLGSFAALTVQGGNAADDQEEEQEWDV
ncbi:hypothetical protein SODALDRAFT_358145 [Sodiomyces alkalinus F11]|uniref:Uncharacterized protein n=1 Tax=Sodiomyces alkalinus (strain CBS 110278 / VKM F-3762 / F11) TaxID=1314773 RepID=A0A3N2PZ01_SODAK|nr:hypothetical protein SODALDRAFT_358145 [Sodiomyces alkalinus F11]ROT39727.1 hypothetical protein SODALDRAFT_358145 [Sodiomyces alkalinus F11]